MKERLKQIIPGYVWHKARMAWFASIDLPKKIGPRIRKMDYLGIKVHYNRGNAIIRRLKQGHVFEEDLCRTITDGLSGFKDPVFLDIGANIGLVTYYVTSKIPAAKIFAVEPGPLQRSFLEMTVKNNDLSGKVFVHGVALGKENGEADFFVHDPRFVALDGFIHTGRREDTHLIKVKVMTLDSWWKEAGSPKVNVVKMDTEGSELWVLEGAKNFLKECRPVVYMEIEPRNLHVYPYNHHDILRFLENNGYSLFSLEGDRITEQNFDSMIKEGKDTYCARPN